MMNYRFNHPPHNHGVVSANGEVISSLRGALDIHVADVHWEAVNRYLFRYDGVATTLATAISGPGLDYQINVASAVGFAVGDKIRIGNGTSDLTLPTITAIAGTVFTLDRYIDVVHAVGIPVSKVHINMNSAVGSMAAPVAYTITPDGSNVWHLTRLIITLVHGTAGDPGLFGDLAPLANGVVLRVVNNGVPTTLTNWKTSGDMKNDMFSVEFDARSGGGGVFGTTALADFASVGTVIRLDGATGDFLEVLVQDSLAGLVSMSIKGQGHFEGVV